MLILTGLIQRPLSRILPRLNLIQRILKSVLAGTERENTVAKMCDYRDEQFILSLNFLKSTNR